MLIQTISDLRKAARIPYAWPGGYPTYFICDDEGVLCHDCVAGNRRKIVNAVARGNNDGWRVVALDINYEDSDLICDNCGKELEAAYV